MYICGYGDMGHFVVIADLDKSPSETEKKPECASRERRSGGEAEEPGKL
jgi:hypothetical protein